jgi:serine/threonine protein kinase
MHAQNVVHLDLKPENFLVRREQDGSLRAFVCDLGQARVTNQGYVCGTFGTHSYRAPEQGTGSWLNGQAADMYSLGMTLHVLLTGTPLIDFSKHDQVTTLHRLPQNILENHLASFSALDASARSLIAGLLCNVPNDRLRMEQVFAHPWMTQSL